MRVETKRLSQLVGAQPKQREFLEVIKRCAFVLYGGAAGGGKSYILRWFAVLCILKAFLLHGVRGAKFGLFCETFPALKGRHLSVWNIPRWLGTVKNTETEGLRFKLRDSLGGGMVMLYNLDDPSKYDSEEFIGIAVDEWCKNPWSVFDELRKRLRWPQYAGEPHLPCGGKCTRRAVYDDQGKLVSDAEIVDCPIASHRHEPAWNFPFAMGSNPGGKCHAETKAVFVDSNFKNHKHLLPIKDQFAFVRAKADDNKFNPPDYKAKNLDTLSGKLRRAYADGDWEVFVGQFFNNFYRSERGITRAQAAALIRPWWTRTMSSDWGGKHHWVTQWQATGIVTIEDARKILGREWKTDKKVKITYREVAESDLSEIPYSELLISKMPKDSEGNVTEKITRFWMGFDGFGRKAKNGNAVGDEVRKVFQKYGLPGPVPAEDNRVPGWRAMYSAIDNDEWFIVEDECETLMGAIPVLKSLDDKIEDVEKTEDVSDDSGDCARYGFSDTLAAPAPPENELSQDELAAIARQRHEEMRADA